MLQVLVGKSIEHARIEVIEEYEAKILADHKRKYFQIKEAELMETQRLEEARARRNDEIDRRNLQTRTAKNQLIATEKRYVARSFAKNFLNRFKRDTLNVLIDLGTLRRPKDLSQGTTFVPQLYSQIRSDMQTFHNHQNQIEDVLSDAMGLISLNHKQAIVKELNKRQEAKKEAMRKKKEAEEEKRKRKERRNALREKRRIELLEEQILKDIIQAGRLEEYSTKMKVYDIRDPETNDDGIVILGGFVGELIMTLTCLLDYILASPQNQSFNFTQETIEQFLTDLLLADEMGFPESIC